MIKRFLFFLLVSHLVTMGFAQHPFYLQLMEKGRTALTEENWDMASRYFEIAAFGFLEEESLLEEAYVYALVAQSHLAEVDKFSEIRAKAALYVDLSKKPTPVDAPVWNRFLVAMGRIKPPPPEAPQDVQGLRAFLYKYPDNTKAWLRLVDLHFSQSGFIQARKTYREALSHRPDDVALLLKALELAANNSSKGREAERLAGRVFALDGELSLVNEFYGNLAVKRKEYDKALGFYAKLNAEPLLKDTAERRRKLHQDLARRSREAEKDRLAELEKRQKAEANRKQVEAERAARQKATAAKEALQKEREAKAAAARALRDKKTVAKTAQKNILPADQRQTANRSPSQNQKAGSDKGSTQAVKAAGTTKKSRAKSRKNQPDAEPAKTLAKTSASSALRLMETRARNNPDNFDVKYQLVSLYCENKKLRKAGKLLSQLGKTQRGSTRYLDAFSQYYYTKKEYQTNVNKLGELRFLPEKARYYLGMSLYKLKNYPRAKQVLTGLDRGRFPDLIKLDTILEKAEDRSDVDKKKPGFSRIRELEGAAKTASQADRLELIGLYLQNDNWRNAKKVIRKAYRDNPRNQAAVYYRARLYLEEGDFRRASQMFDNLVNAGYKGNHIFYYAGLAYEREEDFTLADYMFDRALAADSPFKKEILAVKNTRSTHEPNRFRSSRVTVRIKALEKSVRRNRRIEDQLALMRLYTVTNDQQAFENLHAELNGRGMKPGHRSLFVAWELFNFGHYDGAIRALKGEDNPEADFLRGFTLYQQGNRDEAFAVLETLKNREEFPEVVQLLADK